MEKYIRDENKKIDILPDILKKHPSIQEAEVIVKNINKDEKIIVAYIVGEPNHIRSNQLIKKFLSDLIPEEFIPTEFVWLNNLKDIPLDQEYKTHSLPETETEKVIFEMWKEILKTENFGINDVFFEIGGDSLSCSQVFFLINEKYPDLLTLVDLFKYKTIKELGNYIDSLTVETNDEDRVEGFTL